jgi:lipopolysaccharide transport system ATP-binding protein
MKPAILVEHLSKQYALGRREAGYRTFRESITGMVKRPWETLRRLFHRRPAVASKRHELFSALHDVSFQIQPGEVVGVIGRNGAGKSTLLKLLSRITEPTSGRAIINGRVGSLLEVGTGFHPELTGRENIFLNGAILGMRRREIVRKFDEIVAFAEIDKHLDTPVKHYSSGMYVRLAFAVAAHLEPEILLVDEVLAVGDVAFQKKCIGKMHALAHENRTILFVSHNMPAVRSFTQRCIYLHRGNLVCVEPTAAAIDRYLKDAWEPATQTSSEDLDYYRRARSGQSPAVFRSIQITSADDSRISSLRAGDDFSIRCEVESIRHYPEACLAFWLTNERGERVVTGFSPDGGFRLPLVKGRQTITCRVESLPLSPGAYTMTIGLNETASTLAFDVLVDYPAFKVYLPEADSGELAWSQRPWGAVQWRRMTWSAQSH